ncbi:MAG: FHA domain-containing protein [Syntrophobacteraceae bacterium]|nr:FHA domain-containing protein [Syntrophobacteraceae bacterium]
MKPYGRLIYGKGIGLSHVLQQSEVIIGRSETCDIKLDDPFVSRRQARIYKTGDQVLIQNIGGSPILVNAERTDRSVLADGDMILLGKTQMVFRTESIPVDLFGDPMPDDAEPDVEMTILARAPRTREERGPRLVILEPDGDTRAYPLSGDAVIIGRAHDVDLRLADAAVSRRHARIEKRGNRFHVVRISETSPVLLNQREVADQQLLAGDEIQVGAYRISFVSDRDEDRRPTQAGIAVKHRKRAALAWGGLALVLFAGVLYFGFHGLVLPWKQSREILDLTAKWDSGETAAVQERLNALLSGNLSGENRQRAVELLARMTIAQADRLVPEGRFDEARDILSDFLGRYGTEKSSDSVQARLDQLRLQHGQQLVISGDPMAALREFSSITEESPSRDEAQRALSHIWSLYQKENVTRLPLDQLLARADEHFAARRYTTPIGQNAYAIYQTILALDPNHRVARERIEEMKRFYREAGRKYVDQKNCSSATVYFERYLLISPDDEEVKALMRSCGKGKVASEKRQGAGRVPDQEGPSRERVERMLQDTEGSGADRPSP